MALALACTPDLAEPPSFELVDETLRLDAKLVNAHTYGSFALTFEGGGPSAILTGPANFPGNPPGGPGTCENGLWINSKGKPTAGTLASPHPHCTTATSAMRVVLEPISSQVRDPKQACDVGGLCNFVLFHEGFKADDIGVAATSSIKGEGGVTNGTGTIVAYAIDASTLHGSSVRVGTLSIDLAQYDAREDLFGKCDMGLESVGCLPVLVRAYYKPLEVGGVGTGQEVTGFLWWSPATAPYNY
jgi:hypothetical protein